MDRTYGSGYPGTTGRGVAGRGFPFFFWPVVWPGGGGGRGAYLHDTEVTEPLIFLCSFTDHSSLS